MDLEQAKDEARRISLAYPGRAYVFQEESRQTISYQAISHIDGEPDIGTVICEYENGKYVSS